VILIRVGFISVADLDTQLAQVIIRSFAPELLDFVANLVRECSLSNHAMVPRDGFASSLAALLKAQELGNANESVDSLLEDLRGPRPAPVETITEPNHEIAGKSQIDAQLQERLAHYFLEWVREYSTSKNPESSFVGYITYLQKEGILSGEDVSSAFYRTAINCAVDLDSGKLDDTGRFYGTDSLAKLIVLIIKNYGDKSGTSSVTRTVYYFNKIITIMSYSLVQRQLDESFTQRPWSRFFTSLLSELQTIEHSLPETYYGCLKSFANNLGITQPTYAPRFAFGWLSIISHRFFMAKLLSGQEEGWTDYHRCLMWLLRFMAPFFKTDMAPSSRSMYHATIRVLLVLMHDFPDFLVEYYHTLATAIPPHCVQLRNIVLSAFPSTEGPLPDYYKPLDQLIGEMQRFPKVRLDYTGALSSGGIRAAIDQHVRTNSPPLPAIVGELKNRIAIKSMGADGNMVITWNHTLLHAAVYYLGTTAISRRATQAGIAEFDSKAPEVAILASLAFALDAEGESNGAKNSGFQADRLLGQYYLLSVIADQLRFPSAHTLFYIHFVLFLFGAASRAEEPNQIAERISRVLLERVITAKPHPWGLVITFVELLENESYGFWKQSFVRAEEEIYLFFLKAQRSFVGGAHR
jgi:CCR4-NOT transcription complex subunit 1